MHHKKHLPVKMFFGMNFLNFQYNFFDILNSKTLGCESIGEIRQGESEYNSSAANKALQDAYTAIVRTSYFNGLLYARREDSINPTYWRIEGLKSSNNYGYIKITSYSNNMEEHKYVLVEGNWSWIS